MIVTVLGSGTSQGVPVIGCDCPVCTSLDYRDKRLRSSIHIETNGKSIVIDSGPDFRQQVLRERVKSLDALIFTHEHKDHTAGMDDIRSFNFLQKKDMPIYGDPRVLNQLKQEFSYVFAEKKYPGVPQVEMKALDGSPFLIDNVEITPIEVMHYRLPVYGYRIEDFTYITDAKTISEESIEKIRGSKVVILNALQKTDHLSHLTLDEALEMAEKIGAEKTYLTHLSHKMGKHQEVDSQLPDHVSIAYDGLRIEL
ncbi:MBL fold metallo-hydrolase [uncultured Roseivirga sp.]|uniref:MBL fold metallo-hydrolase n=1 Tax=uncultured Roseivirga sp. TaxID=543088 RepID=UPI000D7B0CC7|nr:MBL fold metallo-hydrolase [uncultured Roseivirga sp.]PWL27911.1 MAG: MBL fold metallo-hydrolase [Roseivirga sp. XM-24bin3]